MSEADRTLNMSETDRSMSMSESNTSSSAMPTSDKLDTPKFKTYTKYSIKSCLPKITDTDSLNFKHCVIDFHYVLQYVFNRAIIQQIRIFQRSMPSLYKTHRSRYNRYKRYAPAAPPDYSLPKNQYIKLTNKYHSNIPSTSLYVESVDNDDLVTLLSDKTVVTEKEMETIKSLKNELESLKSSATSPSIAAASMNVSMTASELDIARHKIIKAIPRTQIQRMIRNKLVNNANLIVFPVLQTYDDSLPERQVNDNESPYNKTSSRIVFRFPKTEVLKPLHIDASNAELHRLVTFPAHNPVYLNNYFKCVDMVLRCIYSFKQYIQGIRKLTNCDISIIAKSLNDSLSYIKSNQHVTRLNSFHVYYIRKDLPHDNINAHLTASYKSFGKRPRITSYTQLYYEILAVMRELLPMLTITERQNYLWVNKYIASSQAVKYVYDARYKDSLKLYLHHLLQLYQTNITVLEWNYIIELILYELSQMDESIRVYINSSSEQLQPQHYAISLTQTLPEEREKYKKLDMPYYEQAYNVLLCSNKFIRNEFVYLYDMTGNVTKTYAKKSPPNIYKQVSLTLYSPPPIPPNLFDLFKLAQGQLKQVLILDIYNLFNIFTDPISLYKNNTKPSTYDANLPVTITSIPLTVDNCNEVIPPFLYKYNKLTHSNILYISSVKAKHS